MELGIALGAIIIFAAGTAFGYLLRKEAKTEIAANSATNVANHEAGKLGNRIHRQRLIIRNLRNRLSLYEPKRDRREEFVSKSQHIQPNLPH